MTVTKSLVLAPTLILLIASFAAAGAEPRLGATDPLTSPTAAGPPAPVEAPVEGVDETQALVAALEERVAQLEAILAALAGPGSPVQTTCPSGVGCMKVPGVVDESGDTMWGDLNMDRSKIQLVPEGALDVLNGLVDGVGTKISYINGTDSLLQMPINFTHLLNLEDSARLNLADGSFLSSTGGLFNSPLEVTQRVTLRDAGQILLTGNTSILHEGEASRVGTLSNDPFYIVANNSRAISVIPARVEGDAASVVLGQPDANLNSGVGSAILGGGSSASPNRVDGAFSASIGGTGLNVSGNHSVAAGQGAAALHDGTFVWADDAGGAFASTGERQFLIRAGGGVGIGTGAPASALTVGGDITPAENDTFALGSSQLRWDTIYLASTIDYANDLLYTSGGTLRLRLGTDGSLHVPGAVSVGSLHSAAPIDGNLLENGTITANKLDDASVVEVKIGNGSVSGSKLADDSVDGSKILDGSIATVDLADGAVTLAKLGDMCGLGEILEQGASGFVCGVDDDTTYGPGLGMTLAGNLFGVDTTVIQQLVSGFCAEGSSIRAIGGDGSVTCETDDDTTYTAGNGLQLSGTEFSVDGAVFQVRVLGECAEGFAIRAINGDGTVVCEEDTDTDTTYAAGFGLDLADAIFSVNSALVQKRVLGDCGEGSSIRAIGEDGSVVCEVDDDTTYSAGDGLVLEDTTFSVDDGFVQRRVSEGCAVGSTIQAINSDGTVVCEADILANLSCSTDDIIRWDGDAWVCSTDETGSGFSDLPAGVMVDLYDADRHTNVVQAAGAAMCYYDVDASTTVNTGDSLYLIFGSASCPANVPAGAIRLTPSGAAPAYTRVLASDADFGSSLTSYLSGGSMNAMRYKDIDGNGFFGRGDILVADRDGSGTATAGDYRWVAGGSLAAGTFVSAADSDAGTPLASVGVSLTTASVFPDLDGDALLDVDETPYVRASNGVEVGFRFVRLAAVEVA